MKSCKLSRMSQISVLLSYATLLTLMEPCWTSITLEPSVKEVVRYLNESYIVSCSINDSNDVVQGNKIKWTKNKATLSYKGHPHILKEMKNSSMLIFERISMADRGEYICHFGGKMASFKLIVVSPIDFGNTPLEQTIKENHSGIIKCLVKGDPKPKIMWKFKKQDLHSNRYETLSDGLKIRNVTIEDRGPYICRALQVSPETSMYEEKTIYVNVQHKPRHRVHPVHARVNQAYGYVGGLVNLTCEAVAEPAANFTWFHPHKKTMPGRIIQMPHCSVLQLFIHNISVFGDYLCKAENDLGTLEQIITLSEGIQPPAPEKFSLLAAGSDTLELMIQGPRLDLSQIPLLMMPNGYRIQYRIKGRGTKWEDSPFEDFNNFMDDEYPYILSNLVHNTKYEVRVATLNIAGVSEYTTPRTYTTQRLRADSVTSAAASNVHFLFRAFILLKLVALRIVC